MPQWWELIPLDPDLVPEARSGVQDAFRAVVAQSWTLLTKGLQVCLAFSLGLPFFPFLFLGDKHLHDWHMRARQPPPSLRAAPARS